MRKSASAFLIVCCLMLQTMYAQAEANRWTTVKKSYTASLYTGNAPELAPATGSLILDVFYLPYHYLISEPDGSRCPFAPSCSAFFIRTAKQSPWYISVFLTADRLTRDANFLNRNRLYITDKLSGRLLDSPESYLHAIHEEK